MDYTDFDTMLEELYLQLNKKKSKLVLPKLIIDKKTTRVDIKNINEVFKIINRNINHFVTFLKNSKSISSDYYNKILMIQGKYTGHTINKINDYLIEYIKKYVICKSCNNYKTLLVKDSSTRKEKIKCLNCNSTNFI